MKYRSCYLLLLLSFSIVYTLKAPEPTEEFVVEVTAKRKTYTEAEKILLAKIIYAESPHEPYEGKLGVGNVVVNRANRKNISIREVIFQRGQFDGVRSKRFYRVRQGDESAYEECLCHRLFKRELRIERQKPIPIVFEDVRLECGFRCDILVEGKMIVEIKAVEALNDIHLAQVLTYLKLTKCKLGLLVNFNVVKLKDGLRRIVNGLED